MAIAQLPPEIGQIVKRMAKDARVWAYAEFRQDRKSYFKHWEDLTVADCEQLAEQYARLARKSIERYSRTGSHRTARTAAEYIDRSRLYRDRYRQLLGLPADEFDQQFAILTPEEAREWAKD